jgi:hypothetical protein
MMMRYLSLIGLIGALTVACGPSFDGPEKVQDLRVLSAQAEPPEFVYPAIPPTEVTTEITFLVVNPLASEVPVDWHLTGCILGDDSRCAEGSDIPLAAGRSLPGEISATVTLPAPLITASFEEDVYQGIFGAAVWVQGIVEQDGAPEVRFVKSVVLAPDYGVGRTANVNPWIDEVQVGEEDEEVPIELDADGIWRVEVGEKYRLLPVSPEETREHYVVPAFEFEGELDPAAIAAGELPDVTFTSEELDEELVFRFYTSIGGLSTTSKSEGINVILESDEDGEERDLSVVFKAPKEPGEGTLWFVVDDERGGVGWLSVPVMVE